MVKIIGLYIAVYDAFTIKEYNSLNDFVREGFE